MVLYVTIAMCQIIGVQLFPIKLIVFIISLYTLYSEMEQKYKNVNKGDAITKKYVKNSGNVILSKK